MQRKLTACCASWKPGKQCWPAGCKEARQIAPRGTSASSPRLAAVRYSIFFMTSKGRAKSRRDVDCIDEAEVVALVRSLAQRCPAEIWRGGKHVTRVDGQPARERPGNNTMQIVRKHSQKKRPVSGHANEPRIARTAATGSEAAQR